LAAGKGRVQKAPQYRELDAHSRFWRRAKGGFKKRHHTVNEMRTRAFAGAQRAAIHVSKSAHEPKKN
jgi:hypothetical protein